MGKEEQVKNTPSAPLRHLVVGNTTLLLSLLCSLPYFWGEVMLHPIAVSAPGDVGHARRSTATPPAYILGRYGYYEQGGLADMNDETRVMELVEDTVRVKIVSFAPPTHTDTDTHRHTHTADLRGR